MKKGSFISRQEAIMIQAIAALLMVFHHLFGFPERIDVPYIMLFDFGAIHIETILSYFGRICISIFAFTSGYGLYKLGEDASVCKGYRIVWKQLKKFYTRFWGVCILFFPLGYALKVYPFDGMVLMKSVLGLSTAFNAEWWYIGTYLGFLFLYPIICWVMRKLHEKAGKYSWIYAIIAFILVSIIYSILPGKGFIGWLLCFMMGMAMVQYHVFETLYEILLKIGRIRYVLAACLLGGVFGVRIITNANCDYDYIFTPIFIFAILILLKSRVCEKSVNKVLHFIGKYSTYIWLTHTFFAYYYFQAFTYSVKYSSPIFVLCTVCSVVTGIVIEYIIQKVSQLLTRQ